MAGTVKIEWIDGQVPALAQGMRKGDGWAAASNVETRVSEGVLHVYQYSGIIAALQQEWHFPLVNIRVWTKE